MTPFQFGLFTNRALFKQAGGAGAAGKTLGNLLGSAAKAVPTKPGARTAAAAGTGLAAASQTPAGQNALNTASIAGSRAGDFTARAYVAGQRMFEAMPKAMQGYHHAVEHTPVSQALHPVTGVAKSMNPAFSTGNLTGLLPHSITAPAEGAHLALEGVHGLGHGAHASVGGH